MEDFYYEVYKKEMIETGRKDEIMNHDEFKLSGQRTIQKIKYYAQMYSTPVKEMSKLKEIIK